MIAVRFKLDENMPAELAGAKDSWVRRRLAGIFACARFARMPARRRRTQES